MPQILCVNGQGKNKPLCVCGEHECKYIVYSHTKFMLTDDAFDYVCKPWGIVGRRSDCITITNLNNNLIDIHVIELKSIEKLRKEHSYLMKSIKEKILNSIRCVERLTSLKYTVKPVIIVALPALDLESKGPAVFKRFLNMLLASIKNSVCKLNKSAKIIVYDCKYLFEYESTRCE